MMKAVCPKSLRLTYLVLGNRKSYSLFQRTPSAEFFTSVILASNFSNCNYRVRTVDNQHLTSTRLFKPFYCHSRRFTQSITLPRSTTKDAFPSSLYIDHYDNSVVAIVDVDLDLDKRLGDLTVLVGNMRARNMTGTVDIEDLCKKHRRLCVLGEEKARLEREREDIAQQMTTLLESKRSGPEVQLLKESLIGRGRKAKELARPIKKEFYSLEKELIYFGLKLPNNLSPNTPHEDKIVGARGRSPSEFTFKPLSHTTIGHRTGTLHFRPSSPGSCYFTGVLALLEQDILGSICSKLRSSGLFQLTCPDLFKTLVVEGVGLDFCNPDEVLAIQPRQSLNLRLERESSKWDALLYLTGVSRASFAGYLTRTNTWSRDLPFRSFTTGRTYSPPVTIGVESSPNLLTVNQATAIQVFAATLNESENSRSFDDYVGLIEHVFDDFDFLPLRIVNIGASQLKRFESRRIEMQAWIPIQNQFFPLASVSSLDDFVSRRLMIKTDHHMTNTANKNYVHMVHGTVMNIHRLFAAILENCQNEDGTFTLPEKLQSVRRLGMKTL